MIYLKLLFENNFNLRKPRVGNFADIIKIIIILLIKF